MRVLFVFVFLAAFQGTFAQKGGMSWKDIKKAGSGSVVVFWFPNEPFGYKDQNGQLKGIEVEIIGGFQKYLKTQHHIDLSIDWQEEKSFKDVLGRMKSESAPGTLGVAGFSFSEERRTFMIFSPSYMTDIAVLVSTKDIPIIHSKEDLKKYLEGTTAITAQGTVLEKELIQLKNNNNIQFNIEYTTGYELIKVIKNRKKSFGYLNLPVYLMDLDNGTSTLNRQNYLTKRYEGRGIGLPKSSDWDEPINEYFASPEFKQHIEPIIASYVNIDLYHFIEAFDPENEVSLLNKEKDIQQMQLQVQELEIKDKSQKQFYLMIIISVVTVLLFIIGILFRRQAQNNDLLKEQKAEIEAQSDEIMSINDNLENTVKARTRELESKNKALEEYAFITAHKLRAPLASILGLVALMERLDLPEADKVMLKHLQQSATRLDEVIRSVMNAIDGADGDNGQPLIK